MGTRVEGCIARGKVCGQKHIMQSTRVEVKRWNKEPAWRRQAFKEHSVREHLCNVHEPVVGGSELSENDFREQKYRDEQAWKAYRNVYRIWETIMK